MSAFAQTLLAVVLTTFVIVAGWALVQGIRQPEPLIADGPPPAMPIESEIEVEPLSPVSAVEASGFRAGAERVDVTVELRGDISLPRLGVGVVDGQTKAVRAWRPLGPDAAREVTFAAVPPGTHQIVTAVGREHCRYAYLSRTAIVAEPGLRVPIEVSTHTVTVQLDNATDAALFPGLVPRLRRSDDPQWRALHLTIQTLTATTFELGPLGDGDYELGFDGPLAPSADVRFSVPRTTVVTVPLAPR